MRVVSREYEKELKEKGEISGGYISPEERNTVENEEETNEPAKAAAPIHEDRLAMATMSRRDRAKATKQIYKEETQSMSSLEKAKYFVYFYKWYFLVPLFIALFAGWVFIAASRGAQPIALSYAMVNIESADSVNTDFYDDYFAFYDFDTSYREVADLDNYINYEQYREHESFYLSNDSSPYHKLSTNCDKGDYDIVITDKDGFLYCSYVGILKPLNEYFDAETYKALSKYEATATDFYDDTLPYGIDVSGTDFAKSLNTGYDQVFIIFPGKSKTNYDNAYNFVTYLFENKILTKE